MSRATQIATRNMHGKLNATSSFYQKKPKPLYYRQAGLTNEQVERWEAAKQFKTPNYTNVPSEFAGRHSTIKRGLLKPPLSSIHLLPRQRQFCHHYLQCKSIADASRLAGYSTSQGSNLLKNDAIKTYLRYLGARMSDEEIVTAAWKLTKLKEVTEACLSGVARQNEHSQMDAKGAIAAIGEMNKMQGHHAPVKTDNKNENNHIMDEEFLALCRLHEKEC